MLKVHNNSSVVATARCFAASEMPLASKYNCKCSIYSVQSSEEESNAAIEPWTTVNLVAKMWYSQHKEKGVVDHVNRLENLIHMCTSLAYNNSYLQHLHTTLLQHVHTTLSHNLC